MDRRELLGAFGAAATGILTVGAVGARAEDEKDGHHHHHMDKTHQDCLKACGECFVACNMMAHHCLDQICEGKGPVKQHAKSHSLAMDCQEFCALSATLIARSSELMTYACDACAEACRCCAEECEKAQDDMAMKECGAKCRACEKSCRAMVKAMKSGSGAKAG